jgi:Xaa-Pro dipeptidase
MSFKELFSNHIADLTKRCDEILTDMGREVLVLGSGSESVYFEDDQHLPFRPSHHFGWFCPHKAPESLLVIRKGQKPELLLFQPVDFWYDHANVSSEFWASSLEVKSFTTIDDMWDALNSDLKSEKNILFYGPQGRQQDRAKLSGYLINETVLSARLCWERSFKTPYEVACLSKANEIAAIGHKRAKELFLEGASERQVHLGYLLATSSLESELPYTTIVGLNEKGAVLHYQEKRANVDSGHSLLIDAGVTCNGYASDITRTYTSLKANPVYSSMVIEMDKGQIELCKSIKVGENFSDIHRKANEMVGKVLIDHNVITASSPEDAFACGLTEVFFPHGFGHQLGLFVHDVAGFQSDKQGAQVSERKYKYLRSYRDIADGMVFTVEPGLYFIESLLSAAKKGPLNDRINWPLVAQFKPCGGIRIEDNIAIVGGSIRNLTREFLA